MKERGDALVETILLAPILLLVGLLAMEYGVLAIRRSQLSESIRSTVNHELLELESSSGAVDEHSLKFVIRRGLERLPNLDLSKPIEINVLPVNRREVTFSGIPITAFNGNKIQRELPLKFEIVVSAYGMGMFNSGISQPAIVETIQYRHRKGI